MSASRLLTLVAHATLTLFAVGISAARAETPVERGAYLVNTIMTCNNCHTPIGPKGPDFDKALSGGLTFDVPPFTVTAPNITQDKETGIGGWSDAEIKTLLRTGVRPSGVPVAPIMPTGYYGIATEADIDAIVAYLRTVKPLKHKVADPVYRVTVPREVFPGTEKPWATTGNTPAERGFYLASLGHCMECHTPLEPTGHDFAHKLGIGGQEFPGPWGKSVSRNLTADPEHGLGKWSDAEIKRAITTGVSRDGSKLKPPMGFPYYAHMADADLDAIIAWLRTVPAAH